MKKLFVKTAVLLLLGGLVYGIILQSHNSQALVAANRFIAPAQALFARNPAGAIALFCLAHLLASTLCIPGSCTMLNTLSGAVFGFWLGCGIVYPITILSACITYWAGRKLGGTRLIRTYEKAMSGWRDSLTRTEPLYIIALRLSPIFPFGLLNVAMGLMRMPFPLYFGTTVIGIFFDVTILNNLGAALGTAAGSPQSEKSLAFSFFALLGMLFLLRLALTKVYDPKTGRERAQ